MPYRSIPWDRDDDIENMTPEDWQETGRIITGTLAACTAFCAWGFNAKFELYGDDPPLIIVRGPRSKSQSLHERGTPGTLASHIVHRGSRRGDRRP